MKNDSLLHVAYYFAFYNMVSEYGIDGGKAGSILQETGVPCIENPFGSIYELVEKTGAMPVLRNEFSEVAEKSDVDFIDAITKTAEGKREFYMVMKNYISEGAFIYN